MASDGARSDRSIRSGCICPPTQCFQSGLPPSVTTQDGWGDMGEHSLFLPKCPLPGVTGGVLLHSVKQLYFSGPDASKSVCSLRRKMNGFFKSEFPSITT